MVKNIPTPKDVIKINKKRLRWLFVKDKSKRLADFEQFLEDSETKVKELENKIVGDFNRYILKSFENFDVFKDIGVNINFELEDFHEEHLLQMVKRLLKPYEDKEWFFTVFLYEKCSRQYSNLHDINYYTSWFPYDENLFTLSIYMRTKEKHDVEKKRLEKYNEYFYIT